MENAPAEQPPIFFQNSPNVMFPPSFHPRLRFTGKSSGELTYKQTWEEKKEPIIRVASIHRKLRAVVISSKYTHPEN